MRLHETRGQVSTEFTIIIAVVLVVALMVVVVAVDIPRGIFGASDAEDNMAWFTAPVGIYRISGNETVRQLWVVNNMRAQVDLLTVWVDDIHQWNGTITLAPGVPTNVTIGEISRRDMRPVLEVNSSFFSGNLSLDGVAYHLR